MDKENVLRLVDISSMIYAGLKKDGCNIKGELIKTVNGYKNTDIPVGGIAFIFNLIKKHLGQGDMVFCADRYPTIKLGLYPAYKEDRQFSRNENADLQKDIAELILKDCGFQVIAKEGYEADDCEYSASKLYKLEYDKVEIYVNDADLYICVDDNVEIMPPAENGKHITRDSYERACFSADITPYNTVTFSKFLFGCKSDCVKQLSPRSLRESIYNDFYLPQNYALLGDKRRLRGFIEKMYPEALNQFDTIYPLDMDVIIEPTEWEYTKIKVWADKIGCYEFKDFLVDENSYNEENARISKIIKEDILNQ